MFTDRCHSIDFLDVVIDIGAHILYKYSALGVKKVLDLDPIQNLDCSSEWRVHPDFRLVLLSRNRQNFVKLEQSHKAKHVQQKEGKPLENHYVLQFI